MSHGRGTFVAQKSRIPGVTIVHASSAHSFPAHMHDEFGIGLIQRGAQRSRSGRGIVEAGPGDLISCNPGEVHDGHAIGEGRSWSMLYLDPSLVQRVAAQVGYRPSSFEFARPHLRDASLARTLRRFLSAIADEPWSAEEQLIMLVAGFGSTAPKRVARHQHSAIAPLIRRIDADPSAPTGMEVMAGQVGLNAFALIRAFRSATGLTPHAYVMQRRLQMARRLLVAKSPIADAAFAAGFADQAHLTRMFARTYGMTPGRFVAALA